MKIRNALFSIMVGLALLTGMLAGCAPTAATPITTEVPAGSHRQPGPTTGPDDHRQPRSHSDLRNDTRTDRSGR